MNLRRLNYNRWSLAFFDKCHMSDIFSGNYSNVRWLKYNFNDRWFADPFILKATDDEILVLVEELSYNINRGRIAKLVINRNTMELKDMKIILDLPTHLSFPMIIKRDCDTIIIPENSASGRSIAYRLSSDSDSLENVSVVIDEPLTDAVYIRIEGKDYILATALPNANGKELRIYEFDINTLKAKYSYSVHFDSSIARNAGCPLSFTDNLYRPAQDCNGEYGKGVILQQITINQNTGKLEFTNTHSLYPFSWRYQIGLHTLNSCDDLCVIDARGLLHPFIGRLIRPIINKIHR